MSIPTASSWFATGTPVPNPTPPSTCLVPSGPCSQPVASVQPTGHPTLVVQVTPGVTHDTTVAANVSIASTPPLLAGNVAVPEPGGTPLPAPAGFQAWVYDLEIYPTYFLAVFFNGLVWLMFRHTDLKALVAFISDPTKALIGFNSSTYDDAFLRYIILCPTASVDEIRALSTRLIDRSQDRRDLSELLYGWKPWGLSIDVLSLLNRRGTLKEWSCKMGSLTVADSPIPFDQAPGELETLDIDFYCRNDVVVTATLYRKNYNLVELRETMARIDGLDDRVLRQNEAGLGEYAVMTKLFRETGVKEWQYKQAARNQPRVTEFTVADLVPPQVAFQTKPYQDVLAALRQARIDTTSEPAALISALPPAGICLDDVTYQIKVGGIHSVDAPAVYVADSEYALVDLDVTSFYPAIMVLLGIRPDHLPPQFTTILNGLMLRRIEAKKAKQVDVAQAMKIAINAVYGKFRSEYSAFYSPRCTYAVTIAGELFLLMLAERLVLAGAAVISANTDGILIRYRRDHQEAITMARTAWSEATGLSLEANPYSFYARTSVNDYLAVYAEKPEVKRKGRFAFDDDGKADGLVVAKALEAFLLRQVPPQVFIGSHDVAIDFLFYQRVRDGAEFRANDAKLPKTIRWYVSAQGSHLFRIGGKNEGPVSLEHGERARLALTLQDDKASSLVGLDRSYYVDRTNKILAKILHYPLPGASAS